MKTKEYRYVDKSTWPLRGEWDREPDKVQWQDKDTELPCLIVRGPHGSWCGYVGVSKGHPYFEKDYNDADVEVHGGLTFARHCTPNEKGHGICHVVEPGEDDNVWWLGFDCAHSGDVSPSYKGFREAGYEVYRNLKYVELEVKQLAAQLKAKAGGSQ